MEISRKKKIDAEKLLFDLAWTKKTCMNYIIKYSIYFDLV